MGASLTVPKNGIRCIENANKMNFRSNRQYFFTNFIPYQTSQYYLFSPKIISIDRCDDIWYLHRNTSAVCDWEKKNDGENSFSFSKRKKLADVSDRSQSVRPNKSTFWNESLAYAILWEHLNRCLCVSQPGKSFLLMFFLFLQYWNIHQQPTT